MDMRVRPTTLILVASLALAAASCGDDDDAATDSLPPATVVTTAPPDTTAPATGPSAEDLDGREFVSTGVEGQDLVEGTDVRLTFDGETIGAAGGCNQMSSTWSLDGATLVVAEMAMTQMACDPPAKMDQDTWLAGFLAAGPAVALDGDTLTLTGDGVTITLVDREVVEPDLELEGAAWVLESLVTNDAVSSTTAGIAVPTLNFADGEVQIETGCNTGGASYEVAGNELTIGPIRLTRMACVEPAGAETEALVLAVLEGTSTFEIDSDLLSITKGDQGLVYRSTMTGGLTD